MSAKTMRYAVGLASTLIAASSFAQNNYALGPVESSKSKSDVVVLGQRYLLGASTVCVVQARVVSKQACVLALSRDAYVVVEGDAIHLDRAAKITVLPFSYVPGASTVMVGANTTVTRNEIAVVQLGSLLVDESALLSSGTLPLRTGDYVEFSGIQPSPRGALLADGVRFTADSVTTEIAVPGTQSIAGTGIQTMSGSGIQSIAGTGLQSIAGTGAQSIAGTGAQSIAGTGAQSIAGTGAQSIAGTGVQSIAGTGAQSIAGTGAQSIAGTGAQSIAGTGAQSIAGTGAQSIAGTGTQSIAGTGTQSIAGTGGQ